MFQSTAELGTELDQEAYLMQQNSEVPIMQMSGFEGENKQWFTTFSQSKNLL